MAGNIAVAQAYLADLNRPEERTAAMSKIGVAFGLAFTVGPGLGGLLAGPDPAAPDFLTPCLVAMGLSLGACLWGLVFLKEPARTSHRSPGPPPWAEVWRALRAGNILGLVLLMATISVAFSSTISLYPLWLDARFGHGPREVGYVFTYIGLAVAIIQGGAIGPLTRRLGEWGVLSIGAGAFFAGLVLFAWTLDLRGLVLQTTLISVGFSFCNPTVTGLISRGTTAENQGTTLGIASAGASLGRIIGPPVAGAVFVGYGPDRPFQMAAALLVPVFLAGLWMVLGGRGPDGDAS